MKNMIYLLLLVIITFTGCDAGALSGDNSAEPAENGWGEYFIDEEMEEVQLASGDIVYKTKGGRYVMQGDILLTQQQVDDLNSPGTRAALIDHNRWPDEIIYYTFRDGMSEELQANILAAIRHWEEKTPFRFYPRTNEVNYVEFHRGFDNSSYVGMIGGMQDISLTYNATVGTAIHEIGHAVGLKHEQCRSDRDQFINVNYDNIKDYYRHNFDIYSRSHSVTSEFDFNSIMIYPSYVKNLAFVYDVNVPVMTKKDGSTWERQNDSLSIMDQQKINEAFAKPVERRFVMFEMDLDEYGEIYYSGPNGKVYEGEEVKFRVPDAEMKKAGIEVYFSLGNWRKYIQLENGGSLTINEALINSLGLTWSDTNYVIQVRDCYIPPVNCRVWVYAQHGSLTGGIPGKYFTVESNMGVEAEIKCEVETADGTLNITLPKGWDISPDSRAINLYTNIKKVTWKIGGVTVSSSNRASYGLGPFGSGNFNIGRVYEFFDRTKDI